EICNRGDAVRGRTDVETHGGNAAVRAAAARLLATESPAKSEAGLGEAAAICARRGGRRRGISCATRRGRGGEPRSIADLDPHLQRDRLVRGVPMDDGVAGEPRVAVSVS